MRYTQRLHRRETFGRQGIAGTNAPVSSPGPSDSAAPMSSHAPSISGDPHAPENWPELQKTTIETPWPIPRKRLEFSCSFIGAFGFLLLAAPVYLFFSRHIMMWFSSLARQPQMQTPAAMSLRFIEFAIGVIGILAIPFLSRRRRGTLMLLAGICVLAPLFIFLAPQTNCMMIVAFPALALLALVGLDAITVIRPAVPQSDHFRGLQLAAAGATLILWFPAVAVALHGRQIDVMVHYPGTLLIHFLILIATLCPFAAACLGLGGCFTPYRRSLNLSGRLLGALGLTLTMCLGLYAAMYNAWFIFGGYGGSWRNMELLWMFMVVAGSLLLVWAGLTQRLILSAADEREVESNETESNREYP
jgi:hypothetical protein